jgi:hypothetical protein
MRICSCRKTRRAISYLIHFPNDHLNYFISDNFPKLQREFSDLTPFCFVMRICSCRKTRRAIFRVSVFLSQTRLAFRFHLKVLLEKYESLFESMIVRIGRENILENLCIIYQELEPLVFKVSRFCDPDPG